MIERNKKLTKITKIDKTIGILYYILLLVPVEPVRLAKGVWRAKVAFILLCEYANDISDGADPIADMNVTLFEEDIARWYILREPVRLAKGEASVASAKRKARARARSAGLKLEARVRSARRKT